MEEEKEVIDVTGDQPVKVTIKTKVKKHKFLLLLSQFSLLISLILYILFALTLKGPFGPYNLNGWAFWWVTFLIFPMLVQLFTAIRSHKLHLIPIDWIAIMSFILVGLLTGKWHPYWALLFIGPAFHLFILPFARK